LSARHVSQGLFGAQDGQGTVKAAHIQFFVAIHAYPFSF
jgi:hypothetical protein